MINRNMLSSHINKSIGFVNTLPLFNFNRNYDFCKSIIERKKINNLSNDELTSNDLIYKLPNQSNIDPESIQSIIDLLLQLRAAQSDQNVFVQNNTVVRQRIVDQLKNELLKPRRNLNNEQLEKLEVISSNNFDEKTLTDILNSLLSESKKKFDESEVISPNLSFQKQFSTQLINKLNKQYQTYIDYYNRHKNIVSVQKNTFLSKRGRVVDNNINETVVTNDLQNILSNDIIKNTKSIIENRINKNNLFENYINRLINKNTFFQDVLYNTGTTLLEKRINQVDVVRHINKNKSLEFLNKQNSNVDVFENIDEENIVETISNKYGTQIVNKIIENKNKIFEDLLFKNLESNKILKEKVIKHLNTENVNNIINDKVIETENLTKKYIRNELFDNYKKIINNVVKKIRLSKSYKNIDVSDETFDVEEFIHKNENRIKKLSTKYLRKEIFNDKSITKLNDTKVIENILKTNVIQNDVFNRYSNILVKKARNIQRKIVTDENVLINKKVDVTDENVDKQTKNKVVNRKVEQKNITENQFTTTQKVQELIRKNNTNTKVYNNFIYKLNSTLSKFFDVTSRNQILKRLNIRDIKTRNFISDNKYLLEVKKTFANNIRKTVLNTYKDRNIQLILRKQENNIKSTVQKDLVKRYHKVVDDVLNKSKVYNFLKKEKVVDRNIINKFENIKKIVNKTKLNKIQVNRNYRDISVDNLINDRNIVTDRVHNTHVYLTDNRNVLDKTVKNRFDTVNTFVNKTKLNKIQINKKYRDTVIDSRVNDKNVITDKIHSTHIYLTDNRNILDKTVKNRFDTVNTFVNKTKLNKIQVNKRYHDNIIKSNINNKNVFVDKIKQISANTQINKLLKENLFVNKSVRQVRNNIRQNDILLNNKIYKTINDKVVNNKNIFNYKINKERTYLKENKDVESITKNIKDIILNKVSQIPKISKTNKSTKENVILNTQNFIDFIKNKQFTNINMEKVFSTNERTFYNNKINKLSPIVLKSQSVEERYNDIYKIGRTNNKIYYNEIIKNMHERYHIDNKEQVKYERKFEEKFKSDMIYKNPIVINIEKEPQKKDIKKEDEVPKLNIKRVPKESFYQNDGRTLQRQGVPKKQLTEHDVRNIVASYIGNIDVNSISDEVMDRIDNRMELSMQKSGVLNF